MNYMLMNAPMALATQQEIKAQTRRDAKIDSKIDKVKVFDGYCNLYFKGSLVDQIKLKYKVGQKLWIREPAKVTHYQPAGNYGGSWIEDYAHIEYLSDGKEVWHWDEFPEDAKSWLWKCKGIPNGCSKSLARTFVIITGIRAERLNEIEYEDILAEGFPMDYEPKSLGTKTYFADTHGEIDYEEDRAQEWFKNIIESISGKGSFDDRWVFVYEYKTITKEEAGFYD